LGKLDVYEQKEKRITIGLDLGERRHRFCALNQRGEVVEEGSLANDRSALVRLTSGYRGALAVMEAGAHSPWVSRYLKELGFEVIVPNPRKERAIYQQERKKRAPRLTSQKTINALRGAMAKCALA
jgi:transposase